MQEDELKNQQPDSPISAVDAVNELDKKILKLQRGKSIRGVMIIVGAVLSISWFSGKIAADAHIAANSASIAPLGTVLTAPILFLGITLILVGIAGHLGLAKKIEETKKLREILTTLDK